MVLKGSLREFILADIFNLLTQQKITGKLMLSTGEQEGIIVFKDGNIVGAIKGEEQLPTKLFYLLIENYRYPRDEIQGLFASFENNINGLFTEILRLNLLPKDVLESFATSVVEDIVCSFFLWMKGTYYFSSVPYVEDVAPNCVSMTVEAVAMEAMRRVDEWNRMQKFIRNDAVFVPSMRRNGELPQNIDPVTQTEDYIFSRIDGISPVVSLFHATCLTEYKAYEALYSLINNNRITPLSTRISQSVVAALEKKEMEGRKGVRPLASLAAALIAAGMALAIVFIGSVLLQRMLFFDKVMDARLAQLELPLGKTIQKVAIGSLQYHALSGATTANLNDLTRVSILLKSDLNPLIEMKSIKELPQNRKNYILYPGQFFKK